MEKLEPLAPEPLIPEPLLAIENVGVTVGIHPVDAGGFVYTVNGKPCSREDYVVVFNAVQLETIVALLHTDEGTPLTNILRDISENVSDLAIALAKRMHDDDDDDEAQ